MVVNMLICLFQLRGKNRIYLWTQLNFSILSNILFSSVYHRHLITEPTYLIWCLWTTTAVSINTLKLTVSITRWTRLTRLFTEYSCPPRYQRLHKNVPHQNYFVMPETGKAYSLLKVYICAWHGRATQRSLGARASGNRRQIANRN